MTSFVYDEFNQLVATTDAVGNALVSSDLPLYQNLRTELGFAPLVAGLSAADKTNLLNRFTERYEYDRVGNRTKLTDHLGRVDHAGLRRARSRANPQPKPSAPRRSAPPRCATTATPTWSSSPTRWGASRASATTATTG